MNERSLESKRKARRNPETKNDQKLTLPVGRIKSASSSRPQPMCNWEKVTAVGCLSIIYGLTLLYYAGRLWQVMAR